MPPTPNMPSIPREQIAAIVLGVASVLSILGIDVSAGERDVIVGGAVALGSVISVAGAIIRRGRAHYFAAVHTAEIMRPAPVVPLADGGSAKIPADANDGSLGDEPIL